MQEGLHYHYNHLGSSFYDKDAIRIIYLQPSLTLEAESRCSLRDTTLSNSLSYTALSYVWGDANDKVPITIAGKRLEITASLECNLRHIRGQVSPIPVWVDAVCNNQNDFHDRNRQVRLMGDIYSTASKTVIFLGLLSSPKCDSDLHFAGWKSFLPSTIVLWPAARFESYREKVVEDEILNRPWFRRVWILQELILSNNPWLQFGNYNIKWEDFLEGASPTSRLANTFRPGNVLPITSDRRRILINMNDS